MKLSGKPWPGHLAEPKTCGHDGKDLPRIGMSAAHGMCAGFHKPKSGDPHERAAQKSRAKNKERWVLAENREGNTDGLHNAGKREGRSCPNCC